MANVKIFADKQMDKPTDGQTDGPKTICPDLSMREHKKKDFENLVEKKGNDGKQ